MAEQPHNPRSAAPNPHDRSALLQAFQDVVRNQQEKPGSPSPRPRPAFSRTFWYVALPLVAVLCGVLIAQPAWLFPKPHQESPALQDASLRVRMYVEIQRIEAFRNARGRLPATIAEAGGDGSDLIYAPDGDTYTLSGKNGGLMLTYRSGVPPHDFLGDSYALIRQRRGP